MSKIQRSFYLDQELADWLKIEAVKRHQSQSDLLAWLLGREKGSPVQMSDISGLIEEGDDSALIEKDGHSISLKTFKAPRAKTQTHDILSKIAKQ